MDEKNTRELEDVLKKTKHTDALETYLDRLPDEAPHTAFRDYFQSLDAVKKTDASDIIAKSGIERTYYYQLMNGTRNPGRDKILVLSIAASLSLKEIQRGLAIAGQGGLYAKNRRDAIIIFCIERKLSNTDTNELLEQFGETLLE